MLRSTLCFLLPTALFASICQAEPARLNAPTPSVLKNPTSTVWQVISALGKSEETKKPLENGLVSRLKNRDPAQVLWRNAAVCQESSRIANRVRTVNSATDLWWTFEYSDVVIEDVITQAKTTANRRISAITR